MKYYCPCLSCLSICIYLPIYLTACLPVCLSACKFIISWFSLTSLSLLPLLAFALIKIEGPAERALCQVV